MFLLEYQVVAGIQLKISKIQAMHEFAELHPAREARGTHGCEHLLVCDAIYLAEVYPEYKSIRLLILSEGVPFMSNSFNKYKILAEMHILPADLL